MIIYFSGPGIGEGDREDLSKASRVDLMLSYDSSNYRGWLMKEIVRARDEKPEESSDVNKE